MNLSSGGQLSSVSHGVSLTGTGGYTSEMAPAHGWKVKLAVISSAQDLSVGMVTQFQE